MCVCEYFILMYVFNIQIRVYYIPLSVLCIYMRLRTVLCLCVAVFYVGVFVLRADVFYMGRIKFPWLCRCTVYLAYLAVSLVHNKFLSPAYPCLCSV